MAKKEELGTLLDFSSVKPFEPLDPNEKYKCIVTSMKEGVSKTGNAKVSCELTILEPEEVNVEEWEDLDTENPKPIGLADRTTRAAGRKLFREYSLDTKALPFLYEFVKAVTPDVDLSGEFKFNPAAYEGMECMVRIQNEAYEEQVRARVKKITAV